MAWSARATTIHEAVDVAPTWAGHPVIPFLYTHPPQQFVTFFDENRRMTVMSRALASSDWSVKRLDETVNWDSHNYIVMSADTKGNLHLAGNMHNTPLVYFRTKNPMDISTFARIPSMTGSEEDKVTYPEFIHDASGDLLFMYRNGRSGEGEQIFNQYSVGGEFWSRLNFRPLTDGGGKNNAYLDRFQTAKDGYIHIGWFWRESKDAATNHTLCHARTKDFRQWENAQGEALKLPLTPASPVVVDGVRPGGGLVNGNAKLGFTPDGRPVIAYIKYDEKGNNQIHAAGWTGSEWVIRSLTDFDYRWEVGGSGVFGGEIGVRRPANAHDAPLFIQWTHKQFGSQRRLLDPKTFEPGETRPAVPDGIPKELRAVESEYPEMQARFTWDAAEMPNATTRYLLRWECLPPNRDQPRPRPWPEAGMMRVYKVDTPLVVN